MTLAAETTHRASHLYIDGAWVAPDGGRVEELVNPATEETFGTAPVGSLVDAESAVAAARRAMDDGPWPTMDRRERSRHLLAFHECLASRVDELAELVVLEAGATQTAARHHHVLTSLKYLLYCAEEAARDFSRSLPTSVTPTPSGTKVLGASVALREPAGVVAAITAFNFPFYLNIQKVGPALAMGNAVVLKPSPYTPLEALVLADAAEAAGLPPGVLNVVTGGTEIGEFLTTDPRVDLISFTGSDAVGIRIMQQAATTLKRVLLELGGKSAMIVRPDADLAGAVATGLGNTITQSGQGCVLTTRHLVHNSIRAEYVARLSEAFAGVRVGDTSDPDTVMGPLIRESQRARVERYVASGVSDGATLAFGGKRPAHCPRGFFFEPTLFDNVDNRSSLAQEEIFGPVAAVIGYDDDDEAIRLANDSIYGLGGHIWSKDAGTAFEMAKRIRTGQVLINGGSGTTNPWDPFGGIKRSGIGRELGEEGFLEFTEVKTIRFHAG
jgi:aldehyde dehydrogenase (NAD+)